MVTFVDTVWNRDLWFLLPLSWALSLLKKSEQVTLQEYNSSDAHCTRIRCNTCCDGHYQAEMKSSTNGSTVGLGVFTDRWDSLFRRILRICFLPLPWVRRSRF
jgi:hypothetical protein